jgi:DNA-binding LytR/AlgR family response regulator
MKYKCIAIDDEPVALDIITDYIKQTPFIELVGTFRNALQALELLRKTKIDLIFLDINMPNINGIQFLKSLPIKPQVIFTTAYSEHAVESYELNALDYLLKPIEYERFLLAVNKLPERNELNKRHHEEKDEHIVLKSGNKSYRISYSDIFYIEASGNYVLFYTDKSKIMVLMSLKEVLNILPQNNFIRIHKSFVVALERISFVENHQVTILDKKIPIGNHYRESFQKQFSK